MIKKLIIIVALFLLGGCATIMHGDSQYVEVYTCPVGATVHIGNNVFTGPARILLKRGLPLQEYTFVVQAKGYKPGYASIKQKPSAWLWGDILWGIIPGLAVDIITGGAFDLYPRSLVISLDNCSEVTTQNIQPGPPVKKIK